LTSTTSRQCSCCFEFVVLLEQDSEQKIFKIFKPLQDEREVPLR
jgi:hypothetical protein